MVPGLSGRPSGPYGVKLLTVNRTSKSAFAPSAARAEWREIQSEIYEALERKTQKSSKFDLTLCQR